MLCKSFLAVSFVFSSEPADSIRQRTGIVIRRGSTSSPMNRVPAVVSAMRRTARKKRPQSFFFCLCRSRKFFVLYKPHASVSVIQRWISIPVYATSHNIMLDILGFVKNRMEKGMIIFHDESPRSFLLMKNTDPQESSIHKQDPSIRARLWSCRTSMNGMVARFVPRTQTSPFP